MAAGRAAGAQIRLRRHYVSVWVSLLTRACPLQASAGRVQQVLLHNDTLRGVQEEEKVNRHILHIFTFSLPTFGEFSSCCPSSDPMLLLFSVRDSTQSQTPPACLTATCGPCTWSTGAWWRRAAWILVSFTFALLFLSVDSFLLQELLLAFISSLWHLCVVCAADYLDGLKTKEEIYNQVYEDIHNNLLNRL